MTLEEKLQFCSICQNRKMNRNIGMVCSLTQKKPHFDDNCPDFLKDEKELQRKLKLELNAAGDIRTTPNASYKYVMYSGSLTCKCLQIR
jgi:hypothetical protein